MNCSRGAPQPLLQVTLDLGDDLGPDDTVVEPRNGVRADLRRRTFPRGDEPHVARAGGGTFCFTGSP
ncbi:MAG: hypothetical protein ACRDZY_20595, partial [Acidimicrobiales bacterium]